MILVGLGGARRAGKDTVAQYLVDRHGFTPIAFADPLKALLSYVNPLLEEHTALRVNSGLTTYGDDYLKEHYPEYRELLVRLGMGVRELAEDFWVEQLLKEIQPYFGTEARFVISDVRFENEARMVRDVGIHVPSAVAELWKVSNRRAEAAARADGNPSETLFDRPDGWARTIDNNGAMDFIKTQVAAAAAHIISKEP